MFCSKCGVENDSNSRFCKGCGTIFSEQNETIHRSNTVTFQDNQLSAQRCSSCGSSSLQAIVETDVNTTTSGSGYNAGSGCLGYLLLGPLGFLCGTCGSSQKIATTSKNKTFWVCNNCGNKFRNKQDELNELNQQRDLLTKQKNQGVITSIVGIIGYLLSMILKVIDISGLEPLVVFFLWISALNVIVGIILILLGNKNLKSVNDQISSLKSR